MECPRKMNFFEARAVDKGKFLYFFYFYVRKVNVLAGDNCHKDVLL